MHNWIKLAALLSLSILLAACAHPKDDIGTRIDLFGWSNPPVYQGDINRKYRVLKKIHVRLVQIVGPNYHDHLNTMGRITRPAKKLGADAVIRYDSKRIPGKHIFDPGFFEVWGTAVKFVN